METIGELLKKKREEKDFSLDTVSEETGINIDYLNFLENSDFLSFKNKVYARSFLRDYANFLCLDTHKILDIFEEEYAKIMEEKKLIEKVNILPDKETNEEEINEKDTENIDLPDTKSFLGKPAGIFVVFILLCLIAFYIGKMSNDTPNKVEEPKVENSVVNKTSMPKTEIKTETNDKNVVPKKEFHQVVVYAHKNLWVKIKIDGKPAYEGKIGAGQNLSYKVKNSIELRGGEPSGCQINVDGKSIGKLGTPGKPFNLNLTMGTNVVITQ